MTTKRVFFPTDGHRRINVNIREDIHRKLKIFAIENETSITEIIIKMVEDLIEKNGPSDDEIISTAASAVAEAHGLTIEEASKRLSGLEWLPSDLVGK